jgi:hypothetical protein
MYLDACCLSRLTDDQSQARIRDEAEAVEHVLVGVRRGTIELLNSSPVTLWRMKSAATHPWSGAEAETTLSLAVMKTDIEGSVFLRAQDLVGVGYGPFDALHIAAAEAAGADVLLTTDDRLLKRAARQLGNPRILVRNPLSWIKEQGL